MYISIEQGRNNQEQNAHIINLVEKWVPCTGSEEFLHKQHIHQYARVLHDKIEVGFLEKTKPACMIAMDSFYK